MKYVHLFASILLLTMASLAQQPSTTANPQDTTATPQSLPTASPYTQPTEQPYNRAADQPYNRPVETGHNWGGWGLLGLIGLGGLLGRKQSSTATYTLDERTPGGQVKEERTYGEQPPRRRAG